MSGSGIIMPDGRTAEAYIRDYEMMLEQIASGIQPTDSELEGAPLIYDWRIDDVDYLDGERHRHIFGRFEGHPFIEEGREGRTSPVLQLDRGMRWARCHSRVYRLRDQFPAWKLVPQE